MLLLPALLLLGIAGGLEVVEMEPGAIAILPCHHAEGDVTWSRYFGGKMVILLTVKNGEEQRDDKRFGFCLANKSLVITNVNDVDSCVYFCNGHKTVYLRVGSRDAPPGGTTPGSHPYGGRKEPLPLVAMAPALGGGLCGAALLLLTGVTAWIFCAKRARSRNQEEGVVYEEISIYEAVASGPDAAASEAHTVYSLVQTPSTNRLSA